MNKSVKQKLKALADHPNTPVHEREAANFVLGGVRVGGSELAPVASDLARARKVERKGGTHPESKLLYAAFQAVECKGCGCPPGEEVDIPEDEVEAILAPFSIEGSHKHGDPAWHFRITHPSVDDPIYEAEQFYRLSGRRSRPGSMAGATKIWSVSEGWLTGPWWPHVLERCKRLVERRAEILRQRKLDEKNKVRREKRAEEKRLDGLADAFDSGMPALPK